MIRNRAHAYALAALTIIAATAHTQGRAQKHANEYPTKPVRFVVPSSPGGGADVLARSLSPKLADALGKPLVV
ncbi:MAG: tripartite tricarboxylate transporter substrate binding protein, partial [Burkholderiales bacterium]